MATVSKVVKVRGGFPVIVKAQVFACDTSVERAGYFVDDYTTTTLKGKPATFLKLTVEEEKALLEEFN